MQDFSVIVKSDPKQAHAELVRLFRTCKTRPAVAKKMGVSLSCIYRWLKFFEANGYSDPRDAAKISRRRWNRIPDEIRESMAKLYATGEVSLEDLARRFGFDRHQVSRLLKPFGLEKRKLSGRPRVSDAKIAEIRKTGEETDLNLRQIAKLHRVSLEIVRRAIRTPK